MIIRDASQADVERITEIYNDVIATSDAIWLDEPVDVTDRLDWFDSHQADGHAILVAVDGDEVCGYASFGPFRAKSGYWPTVEISIHIGAAHRGQLVGQQLVDALVRRAIDQGKLVLVAGVDGGNAGSIRFHERNGFRLVAAMPGIGRKAGRPVDLLLMQRELTSSADQEEQR